MAVTHAFVSAKSDGGDATIVRPSNWNADHAITSVIAINGTSATEIKAYNTYTDASNFEVGVFDWTTNANVLTVGTAKAGTGTARPMYLKGGTSYIESVDGYVAVHPVGAPYYLLYLDGTRNIYTAGSATLNFGSGVFEVNCATGVIKQSPLTVGTLPAAAGSTGARTFVTDANATTFNSIVASGGSNFVPVFCDGTNWRIG